MEITVRGLKFRYDRAREVLENVSFSIERGEVAAIIGPNGAGKSTLLKCMAKILVPQEGAVYLDGQDIAEKSLKELAKLTGYVPQEGREIFPFSVMETVLMGRRPYLNFAPSEKDIEVVAKVMSFMEIEELAERSIKELSGGERQKVFIARALAQEPQIFLFDEPTSNLDIRHQLEVFGIIRKIVKEEGKTVVVVVHDLNLAARFADKIIMLKGGKVYAVGRPEEVLTQENIKEVYGVSSSVVKTEFGFFVIPVEPLKEVNTFC
ncbi:ABC transporter ATP-binding protein [Caldanaerobacter subterraneus]|uniref:ABC transporter ATP-binding protein n=1 Tax=Caldanaerobacter subterraneus TaxID=911092 RepID=A0A7Y2L619_9THEO|nr:ABC transporter ATP-binding protein [Caldanaerobacter subterraneus]NNG66464.1 ABC transporter ATP-binding protein [Caldanaerobacter subterraneus]